jgi:hypothetical protein
MKGKIVIYLLIIIILSCKKSTETNTETKKIDAIESRFLNLDSVQLTNNHKIENAGEDINRLVISRIDSLIWITASKYTEHRIFGYENPNVNSKKMILISCFTADVEKNPFELPLGAYYEIDENHKIKFLKIDGDFVKTKFILNGKDMENVYFEKKWTEFDE